jgi:hypothetical protein
MQALLYQYVTSPVHDAESGVGAAYIYTYGKTFELHAGILKKGFKFIF